MRTVRAYSWLRHAAAATLGDLPGSSQQVPWGANAYSGTRGDQKSSVTYLQGWIKPVRITFDIVGGHSRFFPLPRISRRSLPSICSICTGPDGAQSLLPLRLPLRRPRMINRSVPSMCSISTGPAGANSRLGGWRSATLDRNLLIIS